MEQITTKRIIKSFKDVHIDLENEFLFLQKNHNISDFKTKGEFLDSIGFSNSIATKLYNSITTNQDVISDYRVRYGSKYKFILKPQLERLCEKYNLYVREPKYFLGDIPEKNIKAMMEFKVYVKDVYSEEWLQNSYKNYRSLDMSLKYSEHNQKVIKIWRYLFDSIGYNEFSYNRLYNSEYFNKTIPISDFKILGLEEKILIASVESLLNKDAFKTSKERIINSKEIEPKFEVDLDPIVLFETIHGYLVITAWGDEANDELIFQYENN